MHRQRSPEVKHETPKRSTEKKKMRDLSNNIRAVSKNEIKTQSLNVKPEAGRLRFDEYDHIHPEELPKSLTEEKV